MLFFVPVVTLFDIIIGILWNSTVLVLFRDVLLPSRAHYNYPSSGTGYQTAGWERVTKAGQPWIFEVCVWERDLPWGPSRSHSGDRMQHTKSPAFACSSMQYHLGVLSWLWVIWLLFSPAFINILGYKHRHPIHTYSIDKGSFLRNMELNLKLL